MFVVGEDQKRPNKGRTKTETGFKRINNCVLVVQLATFLTVATVTTIAASKTFESSFWSTGNDMVLDETLDLKTANCTFNISRASGGWNPYHQVVSRDDFKFRLAWFAGEVRTCLLINFVVLLLGALNKVLMETNIMEIKFRALVVRKEILTAAEIGFMVACFVYTKGVESDADILSGYLKACGISSQDSLPYTPPFVALYVGLSWALICHALSFCFLLYSTLAKPPPVPTTRDHFQRPLSQEVKQYAQALENTKYYPDDSIFQSAVDFSGMEIPTQSVGPVGAYPHSQFQGQTPPVTPTDPVHQIQMSHY